jgi:glycosyltransferase involved in cell wall biosynthesis
MRPVHVVAAQLSPANGMERAALELLRNLRTAGVSTSATVLSGSVPSEVLGCGVRSLHVARRATRLAEAVPDLRRSLRRLPMGTVVVAAGAWAAAPTALALYRSGRQYVNWEHSLLPGRIGADRRACLLARAIRLPGCRPGRHVAVSDGVARTLRAFFPDSPVEVIPNYTAMSQGPPPRRRRRVGPVRLVCVGSLNKFKNQVDAIRALALLPDHYHLTLAGDGPLEETLRAEIVRLGLSSRVTMLGRVPSVDSVLDGSDVMVHPSIVETFGYSLLEAAERAVPVVAYDVQALDEMVPALVPGRLVPERTPEALARAVLQVTVGGVLSHADVDRSWLRRRQVLAPDRITDLWIRSVLADGPADS